MFFQPFTAEHFNAYKLIMYSFTIEYLLPQNPTDVNYATLLVHISTASYIAAVTKLHAPSMGWGYRARYETRATHGSCMIKTYNSILVNVADIENGP